MLTEKKKELSLLKRMKIKISQSFYYGALKIMIFGILFVFFENSIGFLNNFMVGHYLSEAAVVAVGITAPVSIVCWFTISSIMAASGVFTAQYLGMRNYEAVKQTVKFKLVLSIPVILLIAILCTTLSHQITQLLLTHNNSDSPEMYARAVVLGSKYLRTIVWNFVISAFVLSIQLTMSTYGKTKLASLISFVTLVIAAVLSPVFIEGLGPIKPLGIVGGALSAVVARGVEAIILLIYLIVKKPTFSPGWKFWEINWKIFKQIIKVWPPVLIAQLMLGLSFSGEIIVFNVYGGPDLVSASSITFTIVELFYATITGYIAVIQYYIGQSLGSGEILKAKKTSLKIINLSVVTTIIFACLYFSTSYWLLDLVYKNSLTPNALKLTRWFIQIQTFGYVCDVIALCMAEIVRVGNKQMIVSCYESSFFWVFGVIAAIILFETHVQIKYILMSLSLLQGFQIIITALMYRFVKWAKKIDAIVNTSDTKNKKNSIELNVTP